MQQETLTFGSVCSGVSAASMSWNKSPGWHAAWFHEIEPLPSSVLKQRFPYATNWGDMRKACERIRGGEIAAPDILAGGTPCQAFSLAGSRKSLDDARGNLTLTFCEIANEIDDRRDADGRDPCVVFWENVPGVLNTKDNAFGCFLAGLAGEDLPLVAPGGKWANAGLVLGPRRAVAWRTLDAQYFGLAQRRRRVFVVASAREGFDPGAVLFESEGVRRDSPPRREPREDAARLAGEGVAFGAGNCSGSVEVAACLTAKGNRQDFEVETFVVNAMAFTCKDYGADATMELSPTLRAMGHGGSHANAGGQMAVVETIVSEESFMAADYQEGTYEAAETARPITTSADRSRADPIVVRSESAGSPPSYVLRVRRLLPIECERLQGFPDDHTAVLHNGKPAADGPRYKAIGNSWAVNCTRWLGQRIQRELERLASTTTNEVPVTMTTSTQDEAVECEINRTGDYVQTMSVRRVPALADTFDVRLESQLLTAKNPSERHLKHQFLASSGALAGIISTLEVAIGKQPEISLA